MPKFLKRSAKKPGASPGTLIHIGKKKTDKIRISVVEYDSDKVEETQPVKIDEEFMSMGADKLTWINIEGIHDIELIQKMGDHFKIHPLTLEDILNTNQRPKSEEFEAYVYFVLKMLRYDNQLEEILSEQVSLVFGQHHLISFQETEGDVFEPVRERIRKGKGRIRKKNGDYLAYALIDAIVDHYFLILEKIGERIETLEAALFDNPTPEVLQKIHQIKRNLIYMRKQVWPIRELINNIIRGEYDMIGESNTVFFNDVYDHTIQAIDTIESFRDVLSGMIDLYLSTVSNRMNEVMKVLTIIATIFIPITFVAGIYGMNFKYMPELDWKAGYFMVWGLMGLVVLVMILYFKKKKWL